jgi:hypothetical protein
VILRGENRKNGVEIHEDEFSFRNEVIFLADFYSECGF